MEKKQNVPELRFQGFSGEWERKTLEEMGSSFSYGLNAAATTYDGQHKYLRITDIDDEFRKFSGKELTSPNVDVSTASDYKLQENDIVFARTGASVGKTYLYDTSDGDVYYAGFLIRVKIDSKYDANFVFQKTLSSDYSHFVVVTSQRSGQPGINAKEYAAWEMLVPELGEQKNIGGFFTDFDKNIFVCRKKIQKLQQFRQAMLAKLFPREGAVEPELRFRGFSGKWTKKKLGEICQSFEYGLNAAAIPYDGQHKYLRITDIDDESRAFSKENLTSPANRMPEIEQYLLHEGDIVFARTGASVGKTYLYTSGDGEVYYAGFLIRGHIKAEYDANFIFQNTLTKQYQHFVSITSQRSGQPGINAQEYSSFSIFLPTLEEQRKIGDFFRNLDTYISFQQKKLERMQRLKAALLEKMFV